LFTSWSPGIARGHNREKSYLHVFILKKISPRTSRPISIKLCINHPNVNGIVNCSKKGLGPLQRGDHYKNAKMGCDHLKIFFSRTTEPE
jgi:hypothetical protein